MLLTGVPESRATRLFEKLCRALVLLGSPQARRTPSTPTTALSPAPGLAPADRPVVLAVLDFGSGTAGFDRFRYRLSLRDSSDVERSEPEPLCEKRNDKQRRGTNGAHPTTLPNLRCLTTP